MIHAVECFMHAVLSVLMYIYSGRSAILEDKLLTYNPTF